MQRTSVQDEIKSVRLRLSNVSLKYDKLKSYCRKLLETLSWYEDHLSSCKVKCRNCKSTMSAFPLTERLKAPVITKYFDM